MTLELMPFQKKGVEFLKSGNYRLLADDMGLGKTAQVIVAANELGANRILVLCPASVKINWVREIEKWSKKKHNFDVVIGSRHEIDLNATAIVINYDLLRYKTIQKQINLYIKKNGIFDVMAIDECHYLKSRKAQRTALVLGNKGLIRATANAYLMSGTPVLNRPSEIYILMKTLCPEALGEYTKWNDFAIRYCGAEPPDRAHQRIEEADAKGSSNLDELAERMGTFMLRRRKEDVLHELPDRIDQIILIYEEDEDIYRADAELECLPIATARRLVKENLLKEIIGHIKMVLEGGVQKLVVFAHHRIFLEVLHEALHNYGAVLLYGGMTGDRKQASIDAFVYYPENRVFIGQTHAAGQGIDGLQKVCSHVIFAELDWTPGIMEQAIDRCRRIGQKNSVLVQYLVSSREFECRMQKSINNKRRVISKLLCTNDERNYNMSIESSLERIATALEVIAGGGNLSLPEVAEGLTQRLPYERSMTPVESSEQVEAKPKASKKAKAEPKAEPKITAEDISTRVQEKIESLTEGALNPSSAKQAVKEDIKVAIRNQGVEKLADLKPAQYDAFLSELDAISFSEEIPDSTDEDI